VKNPITILLALGYYDERLLRGIAAYAGERGWHISAASITREFVIPRGWNGDGVLAWLAGEDDLADFVLSLAKPTVDLSLRRLHLPFGHVALDHVAAAEAAANHFLERGLHNFLYYSQVYNWTYEERGNAYVEALRRNGYECQWLKYNEEKIKCGHRGVWAERSAWLAEELRAAKKPVAILAANGTLAVEVQEVCKGANLEVPAQVAIIGFEDELLSPQSAQQKITAIDPNFAELGYRGAELLDRLMQGHSVPTQPMRIPPMRLITRRSTDIMAVSDPGVAKALRFISKHYAEKIDAPAIARAAGLSVRTLQFLFTKHLHRTPGDHLRSVRIESVKKLLAETDTKIEAIAAMCGFRSLNSFFASFKQAIGNSPHEYRKLSRRNG
jgi:LacI family transcriptional regulator